MKKRLVIRDRLVAEIALIPQQTLVVEKRVMLCIPVPGNFKRWRLAKVVLDQAIAAGLRRAVEEKSILSQLAMEGIETPVVWVDDIVPVPVQAHRFPVININQDC